MSQNFNYTKIDISTCFQMKIKDLFNNKISSTPSQLSSRPIHNSACQNCACAVCHKVEHVVGAVAEYWLQNFYGAADDADYHDRNANEFECEWKEMAAVAKK